MLRQSAITICVATLVSASVLRADDSNKQRREAIIQRIDNLLAERWKEEGIEPAKPSSDSEFVRRVHLDLTGVIPRVSEVREFLDDESEYKREELIERMLASPRYATHMANTWRQIMIPGGLDLEQLQNVAGVQNWLRRQFAQNMRYDRIVSDFLVAIVDPRVRFH